MGQHNSSPVKPQPVAQSMARSEPQPTEFEIAKARLYRYMKQLQQAVNDAKLARSQFQQYAAAFLADGSEQMAVFYLRYGELAVQNVDAFNKQYMMLLNTLNKVKFAKYAEEAVKAVNEAYKQVNAENLAKQLTELQEMNAYFKEVEYKVDGVNSMWAERSASIDVGAQLEALKREMLAPYQVTVGELYSEPRPKNGFALERNMLVVE